MNPPGEWVFKNLEWCFLNYQIGAIYVKCYPTRKDNFYGLRWYWAANVGLESRVSVNDPICGYAKTEEEGKNIIECLLKNTKTCEFKEE
jgi:hypothetical protein